MPSPFYLPFDYSYRYQDHPDGALIPVSLESGQIFHATCSVASAGSTSYVSALLNTIDLSISADTTVDSLASGGWATE